MKEKSKIHLIPIYDAELEVVVTSSMEGSQKNKNRLARLGNDDNIVGGRGLMWCSATETRMAILMRSNSVTHETIAHEVFHATHRLMHFTNTKFSIVHDEPFAYLCGYIADLIYQDLNEWGIRPKLK